MTNNPKPSIQIPQTIVNELQHCTAIGIRPFEVYSDFLELALHTLEAVPRHFESVLAHKQYADDTPEAAAAFARVRQKYSRRGRDYTPHFAAAMATLLQSDLYSGDNPDHVGIAYELLELQNPHSGQYFTPWDVCSMMVQVTDGEPAAFLLSRLAKCSMGEAFDPFLAVIVKAQIAAFGLSPAGPALLRSVATALENGFQPITVSDPAIGSGRMLLAHACLVPPWAHQLGLVQYCGQDIDLDCVRMARINMMLYGLNGWGLRLMTGLSAEARAALQDYQAYHPSNLRPSPETAFVYDAGRLTALQPQKTKR